MKTKLFFLTVMCYLSTYSTISAQVCDCNVSQVKNNTVQPCTTTIGTVVNVSTASQFRQAINQANGSGGNMTILMADGVYQVANLSSYPYITASNIVIRSQSGNRDAVILEGTGMLDVDPATVIGLSFQGNNSVVADLTIRNMGNHAISVNGDELYVHNVRFVDIYQQMIKGTSSGDGSDNGRIQCSLFEYTGGIGPNWYIGGIDVHKGDDWIIRDNVFRDIASPSISTAEHAVHFWRSGSNITVERNEIVNCDRGIGFGLGDGPANGQNGGIIRNNTIYNNGNDQFHDVGIGLESCPNTKVYNNTIHIEHQNAIEYRWTTTTNVDIANNLTNKPITSRNGGAATVYSNYVQATASWFVNPAIGDLRLSGSPGAVIDQGTTLADVTVDLDQTARPSGAGYDLGAYEVGNQPPPPSTPNCNCTVQQVKTNTVQPCNYTIGTVVNVSNAAQFRQAINQANSTGGNMTILIADGVHRIADVNSYPYVTASNIVIRSASGNRNACILEGDGMVDNNPTTVNGFYFVGDNNVVADLTIRNVGNHGIQTDGDYLYVHNVRFVDLYEQMIKGSSGGDGSDNGQVQCSLFEYTAGIGPNWYIGGIDVHEGDNWLIRDNVFRDIASPSFAIAEHAVHFWRTGSNITVERNEIVNCDRGIGFGLGNDPANGIVGGIIRNNTIYNEGVDPFNDVGIGLEHCPDTKIYNNTVFVQSFRAIEYRFPATTNVDIANNLTNKVIGPRDGGTANVYSNNQQAQGSWFVDLANGDLRLSGSPTAVVDQGVTLADVTVDLDQTPRPNGGGYDLGAHETGQTAGPTEVVLKVELEGALFANNQYLFEMRNDLFLAGLLPGQAPVSPTVPPTPQGHPYQGPPWNYSGTEGGNWTDTDYLSIANQTGQQPIDWILVSFRSGIANSTEITRVAALLLQNGTVYFPSKSVFNQPFSVPVYIVVEHRNHLAVMSASAVPTVNGVLTHDFSLGNSYTGGGFGQKEITPGRWVMYGGDGDQETDGPGYEITGKDRILWSQENGNFALYNNSDFTMDLDITGFDKVFWSLNNGIFSNIQR